MAVRHRRRTAAKRQISRKPAGKIDIAEITGRCEDVPVVTDVVLRQHAPTGDVDEAKRRMSPTMRAEELNFHLPPELIAQSPAARRSGSRLLHYRRHDRSIDHRQFSDLPSLLRRGDLLVFNDARVIPARFTLQKPTGGRVEGLFIGAHLPQVWTVMLKNLGPLKPEVELAFVDAPQLRARAVASLGEGRYQLHVSTDEPATAVLSRIGRMPLPPYIKREKDHDPRDADDNERYQTVYARHDGSIAAPTAGLHFTPEIFDELDRVGVARTFVTLHVGLGTFKPVVVEDLHDHAMHSEAYTISTEAADAINAARLAGRRIIAVGTTSARVLESQPPDAPVRARTAETSIFIYPPYQWKWIDGLVTNFHLPRSTLIALVAAMVGLDEQRRIYAAAIAQRYRFFSYGDAMLIE
jgi:S-adenosylmethionine:tRNA ribosyltransferase-isomerase